LRSEPQRRRTNVSSLGRAPDCSRGRSYASPRFWNRVREKPWKGGGARVRCPSRALLLEYRDSPRARKARPRLQTTAPSGAEGGYSFFPFSAVIATTRLSSRAADMCSVTGMPGARSASLAGAPATRILASVATGTRSAVKWSAGM